MIDVNDKQKGRYGKMLDKKLVFTLLFLLFIHVLMLYMSCSSGLLELKFIPNSSTAALTVMFCTFLSLQKGYIANFTGRKYQ